MCVYVYGDFQIRMHLEVLKFGCVYGTLDLETNGPDQTQLKTLKFQ